VPGGRTEKVELPDFSGMTHDQILEYKEDYSFKLDWQFNNEIEDNVVFDQSPKPGKTVYKSTVITLLISKGVDRLLVPEFVTMDFAQYSQQLVELGLNCRRVDGYDDLMTEEYIIGTNPMPRADNIDGAPLQPGDTIDVYVSLGPKPNPLTMPQFQNMTLEQALTRLAAMGITETFITVEKIDSEKPGDTVLSFTPALNAEVKEGETKVKLVVSNGAAPIKTINVGIPIKPEYVGMNIHIYFEGEDKAVNHKVLAETDSPNYVVTLESGGVKTAKVFIGGFAYQDILIDFNSGKYRLLAQYDGPAVAPPPTTTAPNEPPPGETQP